MRTGLGVDRAVWDDRTRTYTLELGDGTTETFDVLISAVGFLNVPRMPDWPGLDTFRGPAFHTARWEHEHDLTGKRVAIVGTGSSAAQIVPHVAEIADRLLIFQREPGWIMPKGERDYTPDEREALRSRWRWRRERLAQLWRVEKGLWRGGTYRPGSKVHTMAEQVCRDYIDRVFADRPDLKEAVTPDYPYWGKRVIFATTYYPALLRDDVELIPRAVERVTETGVVDVDGVEHPGRRPGDRHGVPADQLPGPPRGRSAATGARSTTSGRANRAPISGSPCRTSRTSSCCTGPGTNGGEIMWMLERQAEYAVRVVRRLARSSIRSVEVRRRFADRYDRWLQWTVRKTAWSVSNNYFKSSSGKIVTQWPYSPLVYWALTKSLGRVSERSRR